MDNLIIFGIGYLIIGVLVALIAIINDGVFNGKSNDPLEADYKQMLKETPWTFSEIVREIRSKLIIFILIILFWPIAILLSQIVGD